MAKNKRSPRTYNLFYLITLATITLAAPSLLAPVSLTFIMPVQTLGMFILLPIGMICALIGRFYKRRRVSQSTARSVLYASIVLNVVTIIASFASGRQAGVGVDHSIGFIALVGLMAAAAYWYRPLKWLAYLGFAIITFYLGLTLTLGLAYLIQGPQ